MELWSENFIPQYIAVLAGFTGLMFVWPRMVFNFYLKEKPKWYQLFFCVCAMFIICNFVVMLLGFIGALNQIVICVLFYGVFLAAAIYNIAKWVKRYKTADEGEIIEIPVISSVYAWWIRYSAKFKKENRKPNDDNPWIDLILNVILVIIIVSLAFHFGEYARLNEKFGFSDMPRHYTWINGIINGELFANDSVAGSGFYPFAMHSIIATMCMVFGESSFYVNLYAGSCACILFFIALYFMCRSIMASKMGIVAVFALMLIMATTVTQYSTDERMVYDGLHRFRYTLPQEFALFAVLIAPMCVKMLMVSKEKMTTPKNVAIMILLAMSISTTAITHYYTLGFQAATCIIMALCYIFKLNMDKFKWLLATVGAAILSALIPMGIGFAKVGKWAYSVTWASSVPSGESAVFSQLADVTSSSQSKAADGVTTQAGTDDPLGAFWNDAIGLLFHHDYVILFTILICIGFLVTIYALIKRPYIAPGYLYVGICLIVFLLAYAAPVINLTHLLEGYRLLIMLFSFICIECCLIIDAFMDTSALATPNNKDKNKKKLKGKKAKK